MNASKLRSIKDINVKNKRVLMRVDFNFSFNKNRKIGDDFRIKQTIPTIKYLIKKKAKIILISHLGRPFQNKNRNKNNEIFNQYTLLPAAKCLSKLLDCSVKFLNDCVGSDVESTINKLKSGQIVVLENLRFHLGEEQNNKNFAQKLSHLGDVYINEAFSVSHRNHASIVGIPKYIPSAIGFLFKKEISELNKVLFQPRHPLVAIIGGAKISTKIKVIKKFLKITDKLLLGGALVNTIFAAKGIYMGNSLIERDMFKVADEIDVDNAKIQFPVDFFVDVSNVSLIKNSFKLYPRFENINAIAEGESALDVGLRTAELFSEIIKRAKMVVWNGPLGVTEKKPFDNGSKTIAVAIKESKAYSIIGGGDTVAFIRKIKMEKDFNYISTGGGAMLDYLANGTLPGIKAIIQNQKNN